MSLEQNGRAYGCVFCITGKEQEVAERIQCMCPEIRATAVIQEKYKSVEGKKSKVQVVIMPSYVFFSAPDDDDIIAGIPRKDIIKLLRNGDNDWRLAGADLAFAHWLFSYHGCFDFTKAFREGERICFVSGPLKDMEGMITRMDKRGRSCQVTVTFLGREVKMWLGFEYIDALPEINERNGKGEDKG